MIRTKEEHQLIHYGTLRKSGRYPWGSGGTEHARNQDFLGTVSNLRKKGVSEKEIADGFGVTIAELRAHKSTALAQQRQARILQTERMKKRGWSNSEIARRQGRNESSVRADLEPGAKDRADALQTTANMLKEHVDQHNYIYVGRGIDAHLGIPQNRLNNAVAVLKEKGYEVHTIKTQQIGTGKFTTVKVLAKPGITLQEVQQNRADIKLPLSFSEDHGRSYIKTQPPLSVSSRRIQVKYAEDGGAKADGLIFIRPGVKDLSMGGDRYAQVRIMIDKTYFIKGMAAYKDDLPDGVDIQFHTKKDSTTPLKSKNPKEDSIYKKIADDPELPFGSITRQVTNSKGKVVSALNIVGSPTKEGSGAEGSWDTWSRNLSTQFLSKQSPDLAKTQLNLTFQRRVRELDEINSLTNPIIRKKLLMGFADETDSAAVHLKAANLPRQATKVLLPLSTIKETEAYIPGFKDGERVALVRFPHAGTFEIPQVTVNNRNREGRKLFGKDAKDVIGIHHNVAQHLSGADFDGDTVLVIPNNRRLVKSTDPLEKLKDFDPMVYKLDKDSPIPRMTAARKQQEMGNVSNLITDMTLQRASTEELSRAVRHSMVVIDAEKHGLDFLQSEKDHGIKDLKQRYQHRVEDGRLKTGARTLISQKKAQTHVPEFKERRASKGGPIDPLTGKKITEPTGRLRPEYKTKIDPSTGKKIKIATGRMVPVTVKVPRLSVVEDAAQLSSGTVIERIYAEHSNRLKAMANNARKEAITLKGLPLSPSAKKVYADEVSSLNAKLNIAKKNAPLEVHSQIIANAKISQRRQANPNMDSDELKKIKQYELTSARARVGAGKERIVITPREWEAIQAGAIGKSKLEEILTNTDLDHLKKLALPKHSRGLSSTEISRARQMEASGYTLQDIADHLGIGLTTLKLGLENG